MIGFTLAVSASPAQIPISLLVNFSSCWIASFHWAKITTLLFLNEVWFDMNTQYPTSSCGLYLVEISIYSRICSNI